MQVDLNSEKYRVDYVKFAEIVIEKWEFNLVQKNLIYSGDLLRSFEQTVTSESGGNAALISFVFLYYFRMLDMGVGRGAPVGSGRRKRKTVFTRTFLAQVYRLSELMAEKYATLGAAKIVNGVGELLRERL